VTGSSQHAADIGTAHCTLCVWFETVTFQKD